MYLTNNGKKIIILLTTGPEGPLMGGRGVGRSVMTGELLCIIILITIVNEELPIP